MDQKNTLLYRFHLLAIFVVTMATGVDMLYAQYLYASVEGGALVLLLLNLWFLHRGMQAAKAALAFVFILSVMLLTLIYLKQLASMSILFVLLLPLMILLFIPFRYAVAIELFLLAALGTIFYAEYLHNPANPLFQNPRGLLNLAYTALVIYLFGLLYHISIRHTFNELDEANRQKELLLKEVHHRVKNNLNVVASIIGLQANQLTGTEKEQLLKSKSRIESIAMVHKMLYQSEDLSRIDFQSYMQQLSKLILRTLSRDDTIRIEIAGNGVSLPAKSMIQIGMIANELITNTLKHAFTQNGTIIISLGRDGGAYLFRYHDSGEGFDSEQIDTNATLGLKIIQIASRQLGGRVEMRNTHGYECTIRFENERD